MVQEPEASGWKVIVLDFWVVSIVFSLSGHCLDTYRMVVYGHGAFELCLPSLGFFLTKLTLRFAVLGHAIRIAKVGSVQDSTPLRTRCRSDLICTGPAMHTGRSR